MKIQTQKIPNNLRERSPIEPYWEEVFDLSHGNFILAHGDKGIGKTFNLVFLMWIARQLGWHVFSNIKFQRRVDGDASPYEPDAWEEDYPPGVYYCDNLADLLYQWSLIKIENPRAKFLVVIDEIENFIMNIRATSKEAEVARIILNQNRKLDMIVIGMAHKVNRIPGSVREWVKYLLLKTERLARQHNQRNNYMDDAQKKVFLVPVEDGKVYISQRDEYIDISTSRFNLSWITLDDCCDYDFSEMIPWTKDLEDTEEDDIIYVSKSPSSFGIGRIQKYGGKQWWPYFNEEIFTHIPTKLPTVMKEFYENINAFLGDESNQRFSLGDFSRSQLAKFLGDSPQNDETTAYWAEHFGINRQSAYMTNLEDDQIYWLYRNYLKLGTEDADDYLQEHIQG